MNVTFFFFYLASLYSDINSVRRNIDDTSFLLYVDKLRRKREREHRAQSEIRCGVAPKRARRLKKQIGKSTLRGQDEGIPGGGAYPFPGDLRAKFAWKEANRLSRGELIDNTAVTCSNLDRRPTLIPPLLLPSPSPSLLRYPPFASPCPPTSEKFTLSISIGARYYAVLRSHNPGFTPSNFEIRHTGCA